MLVQLLYTEERHGSIVILFYVQATALSLADMDGKDLMATVL